MGCYMETAIAAVDYLRSQGNKVGLLNVTSFRPFPGDEIVDALKNTKAFTVLERLDVPSAQSNPLTAEIKSSFADSLTRVKNYTEID